jgi:pantoate--beta-alanine ligase
MRTIQTKKELKAFLAPFREQGKSVGFVPTMGALHQGHLHLVDCAARDNDIVVASVFVNPVQFNNPGDLAKYPRDLEGDTKKLAVHHVDYIFAPSVEEMYPKEVKKSYDFGLVDKVMEGKYRPGHFNGVAVVVHRLFNIVEPDKAYFGEKDFQQLAVIRKLVEQEQIPVNVIVCETIREADGLAMSSRNQRLTPHERKEAPFIYATLKNAVELSKNQTVAEVKRYVLEKLDETNIKTEYFEIVDSHTLQPIKSWSESEHPRGCIAAYLGNVRLIDNIAF